MGTIPDRFSRIWVGWCAIISCRETFGQRERCVLDGAGDWGVRPGDGVGLAASTQVGGELDNWTAVWYARSRGIN